METLTVFDKSVDWVCSGEFSDTDIDEAKLTVFQQVRACLEYQTIVSLNYVIC